MKNLKFVFNAIIAFGAIILFGAAGYSDNNAVQFSVITGNAVTAFSMILFGLWGRYATKQAQQHINKIKTRSKTNINTAVKMIRL